MNNHNGLAQYILYVLRFPFGELRDVVAKGLRSFPVSFRPAPGIGLRVNLGQRQQRATSASNWAAVAILLAALCAACTSPVDPNSGACPSGDIRCAGADTAGVWQ